MPLWVIAENKLDQRYGADVKPIYIAGGAILTHSLIAGDVDIALTGGAVVGAILGGADLTYVGIGLSTYAFTAYVAPDIRDINDLRGKVFGVITKGASSDHAAIALHATAAGFHDQARQSWMQRIAGHVAGDRAGGAELPQQMLHRLPPVRSFELGRHQHAVVRKESGGLVVVACIE